MAPTLTACRDCGSSHLGPSCGMTFAERMRSVRLDPRALVNRPRHNYYDRDALRGVVGEDARERMLEETHGHGPIKLGPDGKTWMASDRVKGSGTQDLGFWAGGRHAETRELVPGETD